MTTYLASSAFTSRPMRERSASPSQCLCEENKALKIIKYCVGGAVKFSLVVGKVSWNPALTKSEG
jgi:hypothetical protein